MGAENAGPENPGLENAETKMHFCIFRSCIFLPWKFGLSFSSCVGLFGPSLVVHFPVLHFTLYAGPLQILALLEFCIGHAVVRS